MSYQILEIQERKLWNDFFERVANVNILSSWEWGEFEKEQGSMIFRYGVWDKEKLLGAFEYKVINAKRGKYLNIRQSIHLDWNNHELVEVVLKFLVLEAKKLGVWYIRISSLLLDTGENRLLFENLGFRSSTSPSIDAQLTVVLDLDQSIEEISLRLRKNTRYLIKKGEKMGIEISHVNDLSLWEEFCEVYSDTVERHKWNAHSLNYIKKQFESFSKAGLSEMFVAKYENKVLAAGIFTSYGPQVMYHHSGSLSSMKEIPAMYVLIWEAIKHFKDKGNKEFNFWGVSPKDIFKHPWYGLSLFKRGFTDNERKLLPTFDLVVRPQSYLTFFFEYLEGMSRKLN